MAEKEHKKFLGVRVRTLAMLFVITFLVGYSVSYYLISRARAAEWEAVKAPGFYYLPMSQLDGPDKPGWKWNAILYVFYFPANYVDTAVFNGPSATASVPLFSIGR